MNIKTFVNEWIQASNTFDTNQYLDYFLMDAVLDDTSVGRKFIGHEEIEDYFNSYFIGYNTHTEIIELNISDEGQVHLEVKFTGNFPEGSIGGTFETTFTNDKISYLRADLIH